MPPLTPAPYTKQLASRATSEVQKNSNRGTIQDTLGARTQRLCRARHLGDTQEILGGREGLKAEMPQWMPLAPLSCPHPLGDLGPLSGAQLPPLQNEGTGLHGPKASPGSESR